MKGEMFIMSINFGELEVINIDTSNIIELANTYNNNFEILKDVIENVGYLTMSSTITTSPASPVEKGSQVESLTVSWSYNKRCKHQSLNGEVLPIDVTSRTFSGPITSDKSFNLKFQDTHKSYSRNYTFQFASGVYYGVSSSTEITDGLILSLTKKIQSSRSINFSVNANQSQYIYYCIPSSYGKPTFTVGGFEGGFSKITTVQYTNMHGYTELYDVWRSANIGLGNTTVYVS